MRGLPPVPSNVGYLTQEWEIGGHVMSTSWYMLVNLPTPYSDLDLSVLLSEYTIYALTNLLDAMADQVSPTTCRLAVAGHVITQKNPPAHGAWPDSEAVNTASGIVWRSGVAGRRGWALTYLPGCPRQFVELGYQLSATGWANISDAAINFRLQLESLPSYPPQTLVTGVLNRQQGGVPLANAIFTPTSVVEPARRVVTIRRRMPKRGAVLPF